MLVDLKKVHFQPLADGTIILEGYDNYGYRIERELNFKNVESADFTQEYLDVKFRNRKKVYRIWIKNIDFSKVMAPLYVRGFEVQSNCFHALYSVVAEASYYISCVDMNINFNFLRETPEISKFLSDKDITDMIETMFHAAGVNVRFKL